MSFASLVLDRVYPPATPEPDRWVEERLGEVLWSTQRTIMRSVYEHRRTAVKSCHGVGKSHIAARIIAEWLENHPPGEAFVVSTAPTFAQVRAIIWRYVGQAHRKGKLRGRVNQTEWHIGAELVAFGRKPSDYDESAFQGIHARYVLVVIDEACGVPPQLWDAVDSLITGEDCRVIAIGNPDDPDSKFAEVCEPNSGWNVLTISVFSSPNFTAEGRKLPRSLRSQLVGPQWVADARKNWGEDTAIYRSKVLGEFTADREDGVVPASKIAACRRLDEGPESDAESLDVQLGVDVGAGGDYSSIRERRGHRAGRVWRSRHDDPMRLAGEVIAAIRETGATRVALDVIGIGWGVAGRVREVCAEDPTLSHVQVDGVNVGEAARNPKRFLNRKAELWWEIGREQSIAGAWNLATIDDRTAADLAAPRFEINSSGKIKIESKEEVRKRIGRSTDDADALILAFAQVAQPAAVVHAPTGAHARSVFSGPPGRATA